MGAGQYATPKAEVEDYMEKLFEQKNTEDESEKPVAKLVRSTKAKQSKSETSKNPRAKSTRRVHGG